MREEVEDIESIIDRIEKIFCITSELDAPEKVKQKVCFVSGNFGNMDEDYRMNGEVEYFVINKDVSIYEIKELALKKGREVIFLNLAEALKKLNAEDKPEQELGPILKQVFDLGPEYQGGQWTRDRVDSWLEMLRAAMYYSFASHDLPERWRRNDRN